MNVEFCAFIVVWMAVHLLISLRDQLHSDNHKTHKIFIHFLYMYCLLEFRASSAPLFERIATNLPAI